MKHGFSLVELSIVLVILGLLVGGVMTGQNLIRAAELRSVPQDVQQFTTMMHTFKDKYFYLPGDMPIATRFWGAADTSGTNGECGDGYTDTGTGTQTCNGNGNGTILWRLTGGYENYRTWQHLTNAGMIPGQYSGVAGPNPSAHFTDDIIGENIPRLRYNRGGDVGVAVRDPAFSTYLYTPGETSHILLLSTCCNGTLNYIEGGGFVPEDAWNIDTKMDDGEVATGRIQSMKGYWAGCATSNDPATASYDFAQTTAQCALGFATGF